MKKVQKIGLWLIIASIGFTVGYGYAKHESSSEISSKVFTDEINRAALLGNIEEHLKKKVANQIPKGKTFRAPTDRWKVQGLYNWQYQVLGYFEYRDLMGCLQKREFDANAYFSQDGEILSLTID